MNVLTRHANDYIEILLNKTRGNRPLTLTIFKKLFEELPEQVNAIRDALDNRQYTHAQQVTHKLHGSVGFCGFTDMQYPAYALESCLMNHDYEAANKHFFRLQQRILNFSHYQTTILADLADNSGQ